MSGKVEITEREHAELLRDQAAWRATRDGLIKVADELRTLGIKDSDVEAGINKAIERLRSYEHSISWGVTCTNCANLLDRLYDADMRLEQAAGHLMRAAEFGDEPDPDELASILIEPRQ